MPSDILRIDDLVTEFTVRRRLLAKPKPPIRAVDRASLTVREGEILAIVGESGCGKSTFAKTILGLYREASGKITLSGRDVSGLDRGQARKARADIQYVHQDPGAALDPWWNVGRILAEGLRIYGVTDRKARDERIDAILEAVGLDSSFRRRYPHELSGGQQRRIGLARTLVLKPRIVILDEPTSGLDLSVQATVLALMRDIHAEFGLTYLFISHDLSVVRRMCHRVAIMYLGRIVEIGTAEEIFDNPRHPYTRALLAAAPTLEPGMLDEMETLAGEPPSVLSVPSGCAFRTRCPAARDICAATRPELDPVAPDHDAACLRWRELAAVRAEAH